MPDQGQNQVDFTRGGCDGNAQVDPPNHGSDRVITAPQGPDEPMAHRQSVKGNQNCPDE